MGLAASWHGPPKLEEAFPSPVEGDGASRDSPFLPAWRWDRAGLAHSPLPCWGLKLDLPFHNPPL